MPRAKAISKTNVALLQSKLPPNQMIANASHFVGMMTGNPYFPKPVPSLSSIQAQIASLGNACDVAMTRVKGSSDKVQLIRKTLGISLKSLAIYVETIANANPDEAANIIASAGMNIKRSYKARPRIFSVTPTGDPGSVKIDCKAQYKAIYIYEISTDPNNAASWKTIYIGNKTKYIHRGLVSGTRYYFRYAVILDGLQGEWSPVLNLVMP
ncbi:MAG TPA: fibronectin type III domain-containing protein [Bacteroidia bacterium]|jgi:hypothetical protein|nr:fibronectin type III domain-containing protein [Bacteroidia bacterium]